MNFKRKRIDTGPVAKKGLPAPAPDILRRIATA